MSIIEFRKNLNLIKLFASKLGKADVPFSTQRILLKIYANDLNINLSNKMIDVLLID